MDTSDFSLPIIFNPLSLTISIILHSWLNYAKKVHFCIYKSRILVKCLVWWINITWWPKNALYCFPSFLSMVTFNCATRSWWFLILCSHSIYFFIHYNFSIIYLIVFSCLYFTSYNFFHLI